MILQRVKNAPFYASASDININILDKRSVFSRCFPCSVGQSQQVAGTWRRNVREGKQCPFRGLAGHCAYIGPAHRIQCIQSECPDECRHRIKGQNCREQAVRFKQACNARGKVLKAQVIAMSGAVPGAVRTAQRIPEIRRVAQYGPEMEAAFKFIYIDIQALHVFLPWRGGKVIGSLGRCGRIKFYCCNTFFHTAHVALEPLCCDERHDSRTRTDIKHRSAAVKRSPRPQQDTVRPHFHGASVLTHKKPSELKPVICHTSAKVQKFPFLFYFWSIPQKSVTFAPLRLTC